MLQKDQCPEIRGNLGHCKSGQKAVVAGVERVEPGKADEPVERVACR